MGAVHRIHGCATGPSVPNGQVGLRVEEEPAQYPVRFTTATSTTTTQKRAPQTTAPTSTTTTLAEPALIGWEDLESLSFELDGDIIELEGGESSFSYGGASTTMFLLATSPLRSRVWSMPRSS